MLGSGMNLITTVIGFGMSATFIVFVCTRLICGRIRAAESRPVFEMDSRADLEQPEHRITGLEPVLVASLPTMKYNHGAFESVEDAQEPVLQNLLLRHGYTSLWCPHEDDLRDEFFVRVISLPCENQCTICLGEYQEKEILRIMPKCKHNFHLACIDVWLEKQSTCPVCRLPLQETLEPKRVRSPRFGLLVQSIDGPHIVNDQSQQWLHSAHEQHSPRNESNQALRESIPGNSEPSLAVEVESRR